MAIAEIQAITAIDTASVSTIETGQTQAPAFSSFIDNLERDQVRVQDNVAGYLNGSSQVSVHELMVDVERNRLMLSLALQVRNKLVEGVQELLRTPI